MLVAVIYTFFVCFLDVPVCMYACIYIYIYIYIYDDVYFNSSGKIVKCF